MIDNLLHLIFFRHWPKWTYTHFDNEYCPKCGQFRLGG